jgi:hypothetical protein
MGQIANVNYLWDKCNQLMNTGYDFVSHIDYNSTQAINVEYVLKSANKIDDFKYRTEPNFTSQMTTTNRKQAVDKYFVDKVLDCVNSCARSCHSCTGTCNGCSSCTACTTNCTGSCDNNCSGARRA